MAAQNAIADLAKAATAAADLADEYLSAIVAFRTERQHATVQQLSDFLAKKGVSAKAIATIQEVRNRAATIHEGEAYNGWPNYETWNVHLWLTNDQGPYETARAIASRADSDLAAGEAIKDWLESDDSPWPTPTKGMLADLIGHALQRVDWRKIGEALREE